MSKLKKEGRLILEEPHYDSYVYPSLSSILVFMGSSFFNFFNNAINKIIKEYQEGLEVRFLHDDEIVNILKEYGNRALIKRLSWSTPTSY